MGEKQVKGESVLNEEEIDFAAGFILEGEEGAKDKILLTEQRGLLMGQRLQEVWGAWQDKKWENVLNAILKIPERACLSLLDMPDCYGKMRVESIARVSVIMLFKNVVSHLSAEQVKLVSQVLRRTESGLNREPWKKMFLEMSRKFFPEYIGKVVEALSETGIYEQEYLNAVWEHAMKVLANDEDLTRELIMNKTFVQLVTYIDEKMNNGSQIHGKKLLEVSDALLARDKVYDACQVYKALKKEQSFLIGPGREEIIKISDKYQKGNTFFHFSSQRMLRQIKRVIKQSELNIIIE
jgi:hypothetical protein